MQRHFQRCLGPAAQMLAGSYVWLFSSAGSFSSAQRCPYRPASSGCRSALELLRTTEALPAQLDQPRPLEETQLPPTKGILCQGSRTPRPQQQRRRFRRHSGASALGFIARQLLKKMGLQSLPLAMDCGLLLI